MIIHVYMKKCIHMGLNRISVPEGEEKIEKQEGLHPARRWVVERTFAWLKGFRAIRTRYCHYLSTFIAFVKLACAIIVFRKIYAKQ